MAKSPYQRLSRAYPRSAFAISAMSRVSLWLGPDHVLQVDRVGYTENYKRFYFRDIQAIVLCKTNKFLIGNVLLIVPFGLSLALMLASLSGSKQSGTDPVAAIVFGIIAAVCFIFFLVHFLMGPTCMVSLRTAVQTEDLPSLRRIRRARKFLKRVEPLIIAAQPAEAHAAVAPTVVDGSTINPVAEPPPIPMPVAPPASPPAAG